MDFQLARNLSAIVRAQEETSQTILQTDATVDCLDREIIAAPSSEATEQLLGFGQSMASTGEESFGYTVR